MAMGVLIGMVVHNYYLKLCHFMVEYLHLKGGHFLGVLPFVHHRGQDR